MMWVTGYFFLSPFICYLFLFVEAAKELRMERKETEILLNSILLLVFMTIWWWECFPEPVEITLLLDQAIRGILGIILETCELSVSSIRDLRFCYVCQWSIGMFSRCWEGDITCYLAQKASKHICFNWQLREKGYLFSWGMSWVLKKNFLLVPESPSFQACTDWASCQRPPVGKLSFLYLFIYLFYSMFILFLFFYVIVFSYFLFNFAQYS